MRVPDLEAMVSEEEQRQAWRGHLLSWLKDHPESLRESSMQHKEVTWPIGSLYPQTAIKVQQ